MNHIYIATPIDEGQSAGYWMSVMRAYEYLRAAGLRVTVHPHPGDSLVTRARMVLEEHFIRSEADALMCIDSDLTFNPADILRMYRSDCDVIGGVYPMKTIPISWPANFKGQLPDPVTGLIDAYDIPTGFLLVRRHVIQKIRESHPELWCHIIPDVDGFALFDTRIDPETKHYLSEDFSFCRLAQECGFRTMVDPDITLTHRGLYDFTGTLTDAAYEYQIEGWMTPKELRWLEMTAATMESVVEIGSWKGRSTNALCRGCKGPVYAVDHWEGSKAERSGPHAEAVTGDVYAQFMANVGHHENLEPVRGASVDVAHQNGTRFDGTDMVFIDAGHTYDEVKADIKAWLPKTKRIICGHDYNEADVKRAVDELLGPVENPVHSIWVKQIAAS